MSYRLLRLFHGAALLVLLLSVPATLPAQTPPGTETAFDEHAWRDASRLSLGHPAASRMQARPPAPSSPQQAPASLTALPTDSLPTPMPWIKHLFWGQHGLFRIAGLAPAYRTQELNLRHRMLTWHQGLGLLTFGVMTTQVITGALIDSNPADYYERLQPAHRTLGYTTWGLYTITASLSITAPPARRYGSEFSTIKLHRYLALVHFTGMMLQPWLGRALAGANTAEEAERFRRLHRLNGWITYAAFTGAVLSIFIPL